MRYEISRFSSSYRSNLTFPEVPDLDIRLELVVTLLDLYLRPLTFHPCRDSCPSPRHFWIVVHPVYKVSRTILESFWIVSPIHHHTPVCHPCLSRTTSLPSPTDRSTGRTCVNHPPKDSPFSLPLPGVSILHLDARPLNQSLHLVFTKILFTVLRLSEPNTLLPRYWVIESKLLLSSVLGLRILSRLGRSTPSLILIDLEADLKWTLAP